MTFVLSAQKRPFYQAAFPVPLPSIGWRSGGGIAAISPFAPVFSTNSLGYGGNSLSQGAFGTAFPFSALPPAFTIQPQPFATPTDTQAALAQLQLAERNRAAADNLLPLVRQTLTRQGIDGRGVTVIMADNISAQTGRPLQGTDGNHARLVQNIINGPADGFAPGTRVAAIPFDLTMVDGVSANQSVLNAQDSVPGFQRFIEQGVSGVYQGQANLLQQVLAINNPTARVINFSNGSSRVFIYYKLVQQLLTRRDGSTPVPGEFDDNSRPFGLAPESAYAYPQFRRAVLGNNPGRVTLLQAMQRIVPFVDNILDNSPTIRQAKAGWTQTLQLAEQRGLNVVVAAGNQNMDLPSGLRVRPDAFLNLTADNPFVISVAASDTMGTPGTTNASFLDDTIRDYSSRGSGRLNPTLAAPGGQLISNPTALGLVNDPAYPLGLPTVFDGTSAATPVVSGTIAMMLQVNPRLSNAQIRSILLASAVNTTASNEEEGAGMLNPFQAVGLAAAAARGQLAGVL
jgi:subtilisin family serine protease